MRDVAGTVMPRDMNTRTVIMLFIRAVFTSLVKLGIIEFNTISVTVRATKHVVRMTHDLFLRCVPNSATRSKDKSAITLKDFPHT